MKINKIKTLFSITLSLLLGFICEIIATETDSKNWISFGIAFATIASALIPAIGLSYQNAKRGVSIKTFSWIWSVVVIASNVTFACFEYKVDIYIAINLLIAIVGWVIIYGMYSAKTSQ